MTDEALLPVSANQLDQLANHLVWKIGRDENNDEMVVRVGFASSAPRFAKRAKLHSATDTDVQAALTSGEYRVEWVD